MAEPTFLPLAGYEERAPDEMKKRAAEFRAFLSRRRTVREFSDRPVPREIVEECLSVGARITPGFRLRRI